MKIAELTSDWGILAETRNQSIAILENDQELVKADHIELREKIRKIMKSKPDWSGVS
jgi:hypothetical protein